MKSNLNVFILLIWSCFSFHAMAQELKIAGEVLDEEGVPLAGVTVGIKDTNQGAITDFDGHFQLDVPSQNSILVFSSMGFKTTEVTVGSSKNLRIVLETDTYALDEVVAIGYGRAKKKDLSGSIATVEGDVLAKRNTTQVAQALQGTMPGVMVTRSNSQPGASATIRVRGITTIGDSDPLIIVDGVPVASINDVNAADIQDISVLKDAASASIYGARAAAGVVLITTKRARTQKSSLTYNVTYGIDKPTSFPDMVGVKRYLEMINEFTWNDAGNPEGGEYSLYTEEEVNNWDALHQDNPNQYPLTDWTDLMINDYAPRSSHNLSFASGNENFRTRASLNYEQVDALYDHNSFERIMTRVNNEFTISKKLKANVDLSYIYEVRKAPTIDPVVSAQRYPDIFAAQWDDGRIGMGQNGFNTYARLHYGGFDNVWRNKLNARLSLAYEPVENLVFTGVFAPYLYNTKGKRFEKQISYYDADDPSQFAGYISNAETTNLYEARNDGRNLTTQFLVNYSKDFGGYKLDFLGGYEGFSSFSETLDASAENYTLRNYPYLSLGPLDYMRNAGGATETAYRSYFGRVMFDYKGKYLLQSNVRVDGSSRFHPDYRWGSFPSVSAGWVVSEESFFPKNSAISYLKLKASWGELGNERIGNYPYQSTIGYSDALFYRGGQVVSATTAAQFSYAIQDISWETTKTANYGLESYFFDNRLMLTFDYYEKTTKDMLLELEIPDYMGYENPEQNTGNMYTKGWDAQVSWKDNVGELRYSFSANISDFKSKMGDLGGIVFRGSTITREGTEYNEWYGYKSDGLYLTEEEIADSPTLNSSVRPGDVKYLDVSGPDGVPDGQITPDYDRVPLGGSLPRYQYGGNINVEYKNFDLTVGFQGVGKRNARLTPSMVKPFHSGWTNPPGIIDGNYWSVYNTPEENQSARFPRLSYVGAENNNYEMSDFWLIEGGYFRLKNIVLGYTLPKSATEFLGIQNLRFFASATDLFSIDKFPKGWDPETADDSYITSTLLLGASVKF
ncbi:MULTISPECIES: SusC/RagA family TonB-linked outer membrane protein [Flagellimonas]|uniref:TonB-dependent receptor n=1 Tax=Flagellimonas hadalis TaxID=2597517 RepID=A0A5N5IP20_9FLAO|nr:TonB-dependent receptor [Allomuricauda hadalis]KAB5487517.1 TonB-dependent receptor [Allomuricauda hadalis]